MMVSLGYSLVFKGDEAKVFIHDGFILKGLEANINHINTFQIKK